MHPQYLSHGSHCQSNLFLLLRCAFNTFKRGNLHFPAHFIMTTLYMKQEVEEVQLHNTGPYNCPRALMWMRRPEHQLLLIVPVSGSPIRFDELP